MSTNSDIELSNSDDCEKYVNRFIQEFPLRRAEIGQGTVIKRALPSRHKRMIGAWCFLDHAGRPVSCKEMVWISNHIRISGCRLLLG